MTKAILPCDISIINRLTETVLHSPNPCSVERMGGLTNRNYRITLEDGRQYAVRIPGEGTEELILRANEKVSTLLACRLGVDTKLLYFGDDGIKLTEYIPNAITMTKRTLREEACIRKMADIFRRLHSCGEDTGIAFDVFQMAAGYERVITRNNLPMYNDYETVKATVAEIKAQVDAAGEIQKVPCHNDPLCENWVMGTDKLYLIDWEYAGMNDGMWDLADVSIEAGFSPSQELMLLRHYLQREPVKEELLRFIANKLYADYLWTLWAKARVPYDGQAMEDWAAERYARLKENIKSYYTEGAV